MRKYRFFGLIAVILITLTGGVIWYQQSVQNPPFPSQREITIDPGHTAASTLLLVAKEQGYFAQHGLNVTFTASPSASVAVQDLLSGRRDFLFANEYSLSEPVLYHKPVRIIGTISQSDTNYAVGRKDLGINQVPDLEWKKIGVAQGSIGEYFMHRFFVLHGLSTANSTVIYLPPASLVDALDRGDIDAAFATEPYVFQMRQNLGDNAVVWPTNLGQHAYYSLVCNNVTLDQHPETVEGVLASVLQAEVYVHSHKAEAKEVARKLTNYDERYMDLDWKNHQFSVGLSQSLITSMEDETRWRMRNNMTGMDDMPDFSEYISPDTLNRLKPSAVTLIQ